MNPRFNIIYHLRPDIKQDFWKSNTYNLCCQNDGDPFEGPVYSIPLHRKNLKWEVEGVFCSLNCAKRYLLDKQFEATQRLSLFSLMCHIVYNISHDIVPAPPVGLLKKYSPPLLNINDNSDFPLLTMVEYRKATNSHELSSYMKKLNPPLLPFSMSGDMYSKSMILTNENSVKLKSNKNQKESRFSKDSKLNNHSTLSIVKYLNHRKSNSLTFDDIQNMSHAERRQISMVSNNTMITTTPPNHKSDGDDDMLIELINNDNNNSNNNNNNNNNNNDNENSQPPDSFHLFPSHKISQINSFFKEA